MKSVSIEHSSVLWVVSFGFSEAGEPQDYQIEEFDLIDKPAKTVQVLRDKLGDGVFTSYEAAKQWVAAKTATVSGCCHKEKSEGQCGCCHQDQ